MKRTDPNDYDFVRRSNKMVKHGTVLAAGARGKKGEAADQREVDGRRVAGWGPPGPQPVDPEARFRLGAVAP